MNYLLVRNRRAKRIRREKFNSKFPARRNAPERALLEATRKRGLDPANPKHLQRMYRRHPSYFAGLLVGHLPHGVAIGLEHFAPYEVAIECPNPSFNTKPVRTIRLAA